ncbi:histidine kinase [Pelobium sp.]|nr:histidine kinase [Pelobium sp.]MDA9554793.1 histidine kinase [Pelobium sp.]
MKSNSINLQRLQSVLIHVVFWITLILPSFLFRYNNPTYKFSEYSLYRFLISNALLCLLFYVNAFYLYPVIFKKRGIVIYLILLIGFVAAIWFFSQYVDLNVFPSKRKWGRPIFPNLISYIFIIGISCSYRIITDHLKLQKVNKEKETENLKTELSFLRSQVSPHFMFNVLNNLVALARKKSDKMEPALMQLSSLLRYMLYEGNQDKISLQQEVKYLEDYIDLQKLRFGDDINISFNVEGNTNNFKLEPMILIPFVENAFKHGMGTLVSPQIKITLSVKNNQLHFEVENDIAPQGESKDNSSGIGLNNIKRRLALLYGNLYSLEVKEANQKYKVNLNLQMHD